MDMYHNVSERDFYFLIRLLPSRHGEDQKGYPVKLGAGAKVEGPRRRLAEYPFKRHHSSGQLRGAQTGVVQAHSF